MYVDDVPTRRTLAVATVGPMPRWRPLVVLSSRSRTGRRSQGPPAKSQGHLRRLPRHRRMPAALTAFPRNIRHLGRHVRRGTWQISCCTARPERPPKATASTRDLRGNWWPVTHQIRSTKLA